MAAGLMHSGFKNLLNTISNGARRIINPKLETYSDLYAPIDKFTFGTKDGRLCTLFIYDGLKSQPLPKLYRSMLNSLNIGLSSYFHDKSHDIHALYEMETEPFVIKNKLKKLFQPNYIAMENVQLNFEHLYDAKINQLMNLCVDINSYFVVWTSAQKGRVGNNVKIYPTSNDRQSASYSEALLSKHRAVVSSIESVFVNNGFLLTRATAQKGIKTIRGHFNSDLTPDNYKAPLLPGDLINTADSNSASSILPPLLNQVVTPGRVKREGFSRLKIGSKKYSSFDISRFPNIDKGFDELVASFARTGRPVRVSIRLSGGGSKHPEILRKEMVKFLGNNRTRYAYSAMKSAYDNGNVIVGLQGTISTWVDTSSVAITDVEAERLLSQYEKDIMSAVNGWGSTEVDDKGSNPIEQFTNSIPGFRYHNSARVSAPPFVDAVKILPLYKMSGLWSKAIHSIYHTGIGQIIPFKRSSSEQNTSVIVITGKSGCGKSAKINELLISLTCHPGLKSLPFISGVDIKPSSFGGLQMIKDALPDSLKHLVVMNRFYNSENNCKNPNDTYYGARYPTNNQLNFMVNFWSLCTQDVESTTLSDEENQFIKIIIQEAFKICDDRRDRTAPKLYKEGIDNKVDMWLKEDCYPFQEKNKYWDIFDYYHDHGDSVKASYIQRYCVPTLKDMVAISGKTDVIGTTRKEIIYKVNAKLKQLLLDYPAFNSHSRLDYSNARIISLDLQPVANNNTHANAHRTSMFYMLAQNIVSQNFSFSKDDLDNAVINDKYKGYHQQRLDAIKDTPITLFYDELHMLKMSNVSKDKQPIYASFAINNIVSDIKVRARADEIEFILATQDPEDLAGELKSHYTTAFIMGCSKEQAPSVCKTFGLEPDMIDTLPELGKVSTSGSNFLMVCETKKGKYSYVLWNPIPAEQIWGTSTTKIDVNIRNILLESMPYNSAIKLLAQQIPGGSAKPIAEAMADSTNNPMGFDYDSVPVKIAKKVMNGDMFHGY